MMKQIRIISIVVILLMTLNAQAQLSKEQPTFPDTIRLQMPNKTTIEYMTFYDGEKGLLSKMELNKIMDEFLKRWAILGNKNLAESDALSIKCHINKDYQQEVEYQISFNSRKEDLQVVIPIGKPTALMINGKHKLEFMTDDYALAVYFDEITQLEQLKGYSFEQILKNGDEQIKLAPRSFLNNNPFIVWMDVSEDNSIEVLHKRQFTEYGYANNNIWLTAGASLENVKSTWNGTFYSTMIFEFGKKAKPHYSVAFNYEWMFDFSSGKKNINQWLDVGFSLNTSRRVDEVKWIGLNVGWLVKREGDLFDKDTYRIGVSKRIHKHLSIEPQVYCTDFFKDAVPGIKLKIHL